MSNWVNEMQKAQELRDSRELKEILELKANIEKIALNLELLTVLVKDLQRELTKDG